MNRCHYWLMCACARLCAAHAHTFVMCMRVFKPAVRTTALSVQYLWLDWPEQTNSVNRSVAVLESLTHQWRELPQVYVATKVSSQARVCRDKTSLLSQQKYACRDKTFVVILLLFSLATTLLSRQFCCNYTEFFCRDKLTFLATKGD